MAGHDSVYNYVPLQKFRVMCPHEFDLSGLAVVKPLFIPMNLPECWGNTTLTTGLIIMKLFIVYSEASSANAGIGIEIGDETDANRFADYTTETSKPLWYTKEIDQADLNNPRVLVNLSARDLILITCPGGKAGTGNIYVGAEFSYNYADDGTL